MSLATSLRRILDTPPYWAGPPWLNALGLQPLRMLAKHVAHVVRPKRTWPDIAAFQETLERDGIVVIPNFFPEAEFAEIERAYEDWARSGTLRVDHDESIQRITTTQGRLKDYHGAGAEVLRKAFAKNDRILRLVETVLREPPDEEPAVLYQHLHLPPHERDDTDREGVLHPDRHFPCVKMVFYLNDQSEENGAYVYCPGSQKMTASRLRFEHEFSIRESKMRRGRGKEIPPELLERGRNAITPAQRKELGLREVPAVGGKNTLVVTNNMGFHKRGVMQPGTDRKQIRIMFYHLQRPWYGKIAFRLGERLSSKSRPSGQIRAHGAGA
jgi:hypothetical protein